MTDKQRANIIIPYESLNTLLNLEDGVKILRIQSFPNTETITVTIEADNACLTPPGNEIVNVPLGDFQKEE